MNEVQVYCGRHTHPQPIATFRKTGRAAGAPPVYGVPFENPQEGGECWFWMEAPAPAKLRTQAPVIEFPNGVRFAHGEFDRDGKWYPRMVEVLDGQVVARPTRALTRPPTGEPGTFGYIWIWARQDWADPAELSSPAGGERLALLACPAKGCPAGAPVRVAKLGRVLDATAAAGERRIELEALRHKLHF